MRFGLGFASLACAVALAGCSQQNGALAPLKVTPAQVEAHVAKLSTDTLKGKATAAADLAGVRDALPKAVSLTWATLNFDAASGATVLTDVKFTPADMPAVGVGIAELRLWDFDAAFAKARLSGQRLSETASLARRIEAKGIAVFGIETLMEPAMSAYTDSVTNAITEQMPPEVAAAVAAEAKAKIDSYEIGMGKLILDQVVLRPYEVKLAKVDDPDLAQMLAFLQPYAGVLSSLGVDTVAMSDMKGKMAMTTPEGRMSMDFKAPSMGSRGLRGGDSDAAFVRGMSFDMAMPFPNMNPAIDPAARPIMNMAAVVDYVSTQDVRLDKLYGYLAKGEWPPRTEADLMSYGLYKVAKVQVTMNDRPFYSMGEATLDARKWHWFIPTQLNVKVDDLAYDLHSYEALMGIRSPATPAAAGDPANPDAPPPPAVIDPAVMQLLTKYGLDKPSFDFGMGWNWNATTGATVIDWAFGLDNYLRMDLKYDGGFPSFKAVSDLVPDDPAKADGAAIGKVFEQASTLKLVEFNVVDEGGLAKIYALAAEGAKMMPDDPTGGMMANQTPESLRTLASNGAYMAAEQAGQLAPELKALIAPFGAWLDKGGKVNFTAKPKTPLALAATTQAIETGAMSPAQFFAQLNAKTVHTPPAGK